VCDGVLELCAVERRRYFGTLFENRVLERGEQSMSVFVNSVLERVEDSM